MALLGDSRDCRDCPDCPDCPDCSPCPEAQTVQTVHPVQTVLTVVLVLQIQPRIERKTTDGPNSQVTMALLGDSRDCRDCPDCPDCSPCPDYSPCPEYADCPDCPPCLDCPDCRARVANPTSYRAKNDRRPERNGCGGRQKQRIRSKIKRMRRKAEAKDPFPKLKRIETSPTDDDGQTDDHGHKSKDGHGIDPFRVETYWMTSNKGARALGLLVACVAG